jgi:hypothetical protein
LKLDLQAGKGAPPTFSMDETLEFSWPYEQTLYSNQYLQITDEVVFLGSSFWCQHTLWPMLFPVGNTPGFMPIFANFETYSLLGKGEFKYC